MHRREAESQLARAKGEIAQLKLRVSDLQRQQASERMGRLAKNVDALSYIASHGWKYKGCGSVGMRNGKRGDGEAVAYENLVDDRLDELIHDIEYWLDEREDTIINLSK